MLKSGGVGKGDVETVLILGFGDGGNVQLDAWWWACDPEAMTAEGLATRVNAKLIGATFKFAETVEV